MADLVGQMTLDEKAGLMLIDTLNAECDVESGEFGTVPELADDYIGEQQMHRFIFRNVVDAGERAECAPSEDGFSTSITVTPAEAGEFMNTVQEKSEATRLGIPVVYKSNARNHIDPQARAGINESAGAFSPFPKEAGIAAAALGEQALEDGEATDGDMSVVEEFAEVMGAEWSSIGLRGMYGYMADLSTEPRWYRTHETFTEDADLGANIMGELVESLQGDVDEDGVSLSPESDVALTMKHFPGGGPQELGLDPHYSFGKAQVYPGDAFGYHLKPFEAAIEAGVSSIMPYYGVPVDVTYEGVDYDEVGMAFSDQIVNGLLRDQMGFQGYVNSDTGIINDRAWGLEDATVPERVAAAVNGGTDTLSGFHDVATITDLVDAELVSEERVTLAAERLLTPMFQMGLFENPYVDAEVATDTVGREDHLATALDLQRKSTVLLQNEGSLLPLSGGETVYVLGNVDAAEVEAAGYEVIDGNDPDEKRTAADADVALISMTASNANTDSYVSNDPEGGMNPDHTNPSVIEGIDGLDGESPFGAADACVAAGAEECTDDGLRFGGSLPWESSMIDFTGMSQSESWEVTPGLDTVQQVMAEVGAENTVLDIYFRQPFVLDEESGLRDAGAVLANFGNTTASLMDIVSGDFNPQRAPSDVMPQRRRVRSPRDNGVEQHARRLVLGHLRGTRGLSSPPVRLGDGGRFALDPNFERVRAPTSSSPSIPTRRLFRSSRPGIAAAVALGVVAALLPAAGAQAAAPAIDGTDVHPTFLNKTHYTGEFHSHTSISDGVELPEDAYAYVAENTDVDFFSASEHDVTMDVRSADDWTENHEHAHSDEWNHLKSGAVRHNESGDSDLVAVPGEEVTWYDATGHINLFNAEWFVTAPGYVRGSGDNLGGAFPVGDFMYDLPTFYARLALDPDVIGQFNHPSPTGKGNFDGFNNLTRQADERMSLFEHKGASYDGQWQLALDSGWHLAPVFNGDEHSANWVTSNPALTGVWADEKSLDAVHRAMRERSMYSTLDENAILAFAANDQMMGSVLSADTDALDVVVQAADPDASDSFTSIQIVTNKGEIAHDFGALDGNVQDLSASLDVADGDYYFVKAKQADGAQLVSAPIWIGETVRGANYAPEITVEPGAPEFAAAGARIDLPRFTAIDDSGKTPTTTVEVYNSEHRVDVDGDAFTIEGYDDHFIVIKATDADGSTSAEVHRIQVRDDSLDPEEVFRHLGAVATVGAEPGDAGLSVATDINVEKTWAKITPVGSFFDLGSETIASSNDHVFEVDSVATEADTYLDSITAHALRSHEFDLTGLEQGTRYEYRFGVGENGPWTDIRGEFVAGGAEDAPVYVLGDVQVNSGEQADFELPAQMLEQLREQRGGGDTVIQVGDLVDNGGNSAEWTDTFEYSLRDLDLQFATMVGNHETYGDHEVNTALSPERSRIFTSMFNLPKNGSAVGESNYSFDRGSIHFSVLNSNYDLDAQLAWLEDDVRASDAEWNVVMGHFPYYGGRHSSDAGMSISRAKITQTLQQLGVDLHIGGHDHVYKRSTILDGAIVTDDTQRDLGTTFVTMGSSGPKFYDNQVQWWDDTVYDVDTQTGLVLEAADGELQARVYTIDGELVDEFAVDKPESMFRVTSHAVEDGELREVGVLSTAGAPEGATLVAAAYDLSGEQLLDVRTATVELDHRGIEQLVAFDSPLPVRSDSTIRLYAWDGLGTGRQLAPGILVREGMPGEGTADTPYELHTWADIEKISQEPQAHYALMNDLVLDETERVQIGAGATPFAGVFDGRGHTISGFAAEPSSGSGLFQTNDGTIHDLAVVDADITALVGTAGILADVNNGTIERSWTSGSLSAPSRAGGLVGDSTGTIRDSYSTAQVRVSGTEAGGLIGVALGGSLTENVYASGGVGADTRNTGGVVGYGYNETTIRNAMSLNVAVTAPSYAHAVLGRVISGQAATLENNHASEETFVSAESLSEAPAADNLKGARVPASVATTPEHFTGTLGWNLDDTWMWNPDAERPVLRSNPEEYVKPAPELPTNEEGFFEIATAEELRLIDEFPTERFTLTTDISLAGSTFSPLGALVPFSGELAGAGHTISGMHSESGGLFNLNGGHIHDLGIEDAQVSSTVPRAGILANVSTGVVERVYTTGEITAPSRVGGILGDSSGELRNAYTTANVHGDATEVGGAVGVALAGSVSEHVYTTGAAAADLRNVGGAFGYGYTGTVIRNSVSLAPTVTAPSWAHRFLGRVLSGNTATLENNWASAATTATVPADASAPSTTNLHGATATTEQLDGFGFYRDTLGFDTDTWQWSNAETRPLLSGVGEARGRDEGDQESPDDESPAAPNLPIGPEGEFLVDEPSDFAEIGAYPAESYRLVSDIDVAGADVRVASLFTGVFDGDGYSITGYRSETGGLFGEVTGTVRRLALVEADVTSAASNVGLLVDRLSESGEVVEVRTSGSITGAATVGGIVGYLYGTISDSYSQADVTVNAGRQSGGIAGIAGRGSTTQRVYATGAIESVADQNAGGVVGYSYATTTVKQSVALNSAITASSHAGRVAARELGSERATFEDNFAVDSIILTGQTVTDEGRQTRNGETISADAAAQQSTYEAIDWDFSAVWEWDADASRPALIHAR